MTTARSSDRAELAFMVIGPERRERLIARYADGLSIRWGMTMDAARRYASGLVDDGDPVAILAVGQTWSQRDGQTLPGGDLFRFAGEKSYTVAGFTGDGMVMVGDGSFHLGSHLFNDMWLTAWPDIFDMVDDPQPPKVALADPEEADNEDREHFDPRSLWVMARREREDGLPLGEGLPLLGAHYRAVNWHKPEYEPSYGNALDIPAYLDGHLADYRAGWPDFRDRFARREALDYFNTLDDGTEVGVAVSAYLGEWLWQRVRSDVVTEYGGAIDDYSVMFEWSPGMADVVIEAAPYAHPEWAVPSDHPLAQCDGQTSLLFEASCTTPPGSAVEPALSRPGPADPTDTPRKITDEGDPR